MSPLQIEIAIHYRCSPGDYDPARLDAPAVQDAIGIFLQLGLLKKSDKPGQKFEGVEEPLRMYVAALERVPLPRLTWLFP